MTAPVMLLERVDGVGVLTLNRPERLNALSHSLLEDLRHAVGECETDRSIRAIVLTGAGRAFCAGADLSAGPTDAEDTLRRLYNPLITDLIALSKPLIAAINGVAVGAAVSLALACDVRIAAESASFRLPFVTMGLVPDAGATWLLPRLVGPARASELALLGRPVGAADALSWGLINAVAPDNTALDVALDWAREARRLSSSVAAVRALLHESWARTLEQQIDAEATAQGVAQRGPDYSEARRAFSEKRAPVFLRD